MTECLSKTHSPGKDGQVFGVAPDQSVLYDWMRVLAGGGVSEFSEIRMRGPLTLSNGDPVEGSWFIESFTGSAQQLDLSAAAPIARALVNDTTPLKVVQASNGLVAEAGPTMAITNETGRTLEHVEIHYSLTLRTQTPGASIAASAIKLVVVQNWNNVGETVLNYFGPVAQVSLVADNAVTVSGVCYVTNWLNNTNLAFGVGKASAAAGPIVVTESGSLMLRTLSKF